ncbi:IS66 family insertion sequence element accessory protein TnpB [[Clostridium] scindens]|uniref:IS66 family insertion sequence element accessory protein TnpA n=1 Tax=Clostridium scindens (strain JCM 10418 / VPI 12708) TaxID=29347 RepID=UPI001D07DCC1|nr:IS66 family insertion sequence element accessory protein TnpB [[Clostridium] scindens]MCB6647497.1 IS66 family insertion sequence element accessory protein TnpB [[Clostridium] scindens]
MSKEEKSSFWSGRIQEFRSSGQTCKDWCEEHQIPVSTMTYWIRKLNRKEESIGDPEPVFAKLPSESEIAMRDTAEGSAAVSIYISGCIRIEAAPSCPPELFRVLVRTLKENA